MWKHLLSRLPIPTTGEREREFERVEVGWECEPGRCRVFGRGLDGFRGWDPDYDRYRFGCCEGGEEEAVWKNIFESLEW